MNRYAVFFLILTSINTNIKTTTLADNSNTSKQLDVPTENPNIIDKNVLMKKFKERFETLISYKDLVTTEQRNAAFKVENECRDKTIKFLNDNPHVRDFNENDVIMRLRTCIAVFASTKAKDEYEKYIISQQSETLKEARDWENGAVLEIAEKVDFKANLAFKENANVYSEAIQEKNLNYLFDGGFEKRFHSKIEGSFKLLLETLKGNSNFSNLPLQVQNQILEKI